MAHRQKIYRAKKSRAKVRVPIKRITILLTLGLAITAALGYSRIQAGLNTPTDADASITDRQSFTIKAGQGASQAINNLYLQDYISSPSIVKAYMRLTGMQGEVKQGTYKISKGMSPIEIIDIITGKVAQERWLVIPEGWRLNQIGKRLEANHVGTAKEFYEATKNIPETFKFKDEIPEGQTLEGYLFPDSYKLSTSATQSEVISKALNNFEKKITPEIEQQVSQSPYSFHEILTLASLIEREAMGYDQMQMISGIMYNRLNNNMRLDIDASVGFAVNEWERDLTRSQLNVDSPYNTRKFKGLPPGPISTMSVNAIKATLNPKESDYFYYIHTDQGEVKYAKSLDEHNANVAKYLR